MFFNLEKHLTVVLQVARKRLYSNVGDFLYRSLPAVPLEPGTANYKGIAANQVDSGMLYRKPVALPHLEINTKGLRVASLFLS